jgi:hypothetical protein
MAGIGADEGRWAQPLSLKGLGQLTAEWLEGSIEGSPWNGGSSPDLETTPLLGYLSAMNRLGYVTEFSQPGIAGSQRASVAGFCERVQAECLASLSLSSDLVVVSEYPGVEATYELPITQEERRTFTVLAGRPILDRSSGFHLRTLSVLSECLYVSVVDPSWGRDDLLWASVVAALKRDPRRCAGSLIDPASF